MKTHVVIAGAALAALLLGRTVTAEENARVAAAPPVQVSEAQMVAQGRALYTQHCSHCHGFNMVNPGTIAYDLRQFPHNDKARFVHSVTEGKNGRMPRWGDVLKVDEIDEIWAYVLTGGAQ